MTRNTTNSVDRFEVYNPDLGLIRLQIVTIGLNIVIECFHPSIIR